MQRHVRAMLHRLRPANPVEAGLAEALGNLVSFWQARRPATRFALTVSIDEDTLADPTMSAIYRLVQEGLSNAVRHGRPDLIEIMVAAGGIGEVIVSVADNGSGLAESSDPGLGITGMRERVSALGGSLLIEARESGTGLVVTARLPCGVAMEDA
jgi:two-component system sensor histidine kinase UhpB